MLHEHIYGHCRKVYQLFLDNHRRLQYCTPFILHRLNQVQNDAVMSNKVMSAISECLVAEWLNVM